MRAPPDLRLYAIVDPERAGGRDLADLARSVAANGATLVQLRDKRSETREMIETARAVKRALAPLAVPFLVNDRVDVALAAGADGVHLGPDDMAVADARALLGPEAIVGLSIKTVDAAETARIDLIDYAGVGGVYATLSKEQKSAPIGTQWLGARRCRAAPPRAKFAGLRHCRHRRHQCRRCHRRRRRRHRRHFRAFAGARSRRRRARLARGGRCDAGEARLVITSPGRC